MSTREQQLARLRRFNASILDTDATLAEESRDLARVETLEAVTDVAQTGGTRECRKLNKS